ncbi:hypothetical protein [Halorussus lipolyticus]|uniref:hypothetical protein n=1 Tax=Halorussus lipolyticus TaxID=3034024 RepID=UPI0023E7D17D|nr:hypothetical protein [Halorussus sp. DT80]
MALDAGVETGSPIDFSDRAESYADEPRFLHLAVCASEYETMARTPFEQAASGQVLVIRDELWIHDCVPDDYRFAGDPEELGELAAEAVEHWGQARAIRPRLGRRTGPRCPRGRSRRERGRGASGHALAGGSALVCERA